MAIKERIIQIKERYGLNFSQIVLENAYEWAKKEAKKQSLEKVETFISAKIESTKLCNGIVSLSGKDEIEASDFELVQFQTSSPYATENITEHISSLNLNNPNGFSIINLDDTYPKDPYQKIQLIYYRASRPWPEIKSDFLLLEERLLIWRLFDTLEVYKLQHGLTNKSLNGVSLDFNQQGIREYKQQLMNDIQNLRLKILPFSKCQYNSGKGGLIHSVLIPKSY